MAGKKEKYIEFELTGDTGKTKIYAVKNKHHGNTLGEVKWHGPWRQYTFFPEGNTVFSRGCMADINEFIGKLSGERKKRR